MPAGSEFMKPVGSNFGSDKIEIESEPISNPELQLANNFVEQTACNLFLTGKAGTGKTTFLKNLDKTTGKNMVITAPTGVAAINAGGVTLHSFFQLPLGPFVPGSEHLQGGNRSQYRLSKEKKTILKNLDLLVIDEISMVRADTLDAIDSTLCRYRGNSLPFGGVQLLMIGDLHQLPPVAKREEWSLLKQYYDSVYFFSSRALARSAFICIELNHIYRQTDEVFINILNQLRENRLDAFSLSELNRRYIEDYIPIDDQGYITLTTHNATAESLNESRLQGLAGKKTYLPAEISGEFQKNSYPAPEELRLKKGAQVMFLRNDNSSEKRYFNGKTGTITRITREEIEIVCPDSPKTITIEPVVWENIKYSLNKKTMKVEEDVIGTFKQFPLKLAWAITIHKSQGLTFEKTIIDSQSAFVHGQTYVALSRCKTLDGIVLSSPISQRGIAMDQALKDFDHYLRRNAPSNEVLQKAKVDFQQNLLLDCFDLKSVKSHFNKLVRLMLDYRRRVHFVGWGEIEQIIKRANQDLFTVSDNFKRQLQKIFQNGKLPESDPYVLERLNKASIWFQQKTEEVLIKPLEAFHFETDNAIVEAKLKDTAKQLRQTITVKLAGIKSVEKGFSPSGYQSKIRLAQIGEPSKAAIDNRLEPDHENPELITELKKWRLKKAETERRSRSHILAYQVLFDIAETLPETLAELGKIKRVGKKKLQNYGEELVELVRRYVKKHGVKKAEPWKGHLEKSRSKREKISETKRISFKMFSGGLTTDEIAKKRELTKSTIEGHLCFFIEQGKIDINRLVPKEKQAIIKEKIKTTGTHSLSAIKERLGDDYSYGEIKMVVAFQNYLEE